MKTRQLSLFRIGLIFFVSALVIACALPSLGSGTQVTVTPSPSSTPELIMPPTLTDTVAPPPSDTPLPTQTLRPTEPPPTHTPQASPTPKAQDFYTEEFDGSLNDWDLFFMSGDADLADVYTDNGRLTFYLNGKEIYAYLAYLPYYYSDVELTAVVENRGYNNNNISLICRYDPSVGWYEFNIANNGLYWILFFDAQGNSYEFLTNGGSTSIKMGKRSTNTRRSARAIS